MAASSIRKTFFQKERAKVLNTTRSQFLANMSHEIRTPLNSIIGMAELLEETPLSDHQKDYVSIFKTAGETLLNLVNDMQDIVNLESGSLQLECSTFNLQELLSDTADTISVRVGKKHINYTCTLKENLPKLVKGDRGRLKQVLLNLLDNTIKFTSVGEIILEVKPIKCQNNPLGDIGLLFKIKDTSLGISPERMTNIIEFFNQVDSSISRQNCGSDLGLTVSNELVRLMKGRIWVTSDPKQGSVIYFTAWFMAPDQEQNRITNRNGQYTIKPLKILLAEDSPDNRFLIQHYLKGTSHCLDIAVDGEKALDMAQAKAFDLILMDIQMPIMDGYEATKQIRVWEDQNNRPPVPIIALTAYAMANDIKEALRCGCNAHLAKPIKKKTLLNFINQYSSSRLIPTNISIR